MKLDRLTAVEAYTLLGIGRRQLDKLVKASKLPRHGKDRKPFYVWNEIRDAYFLVRPSKPAKAQDSDPEAADTIEKAELRQKNADADLKELKAAKMRGELVEVNEVERQIGRVYSNLGTRLRAIPAKVTRELFGETSRAKFKNAIEEEIEQAQRELVEIAANQSADEDDDGDNG